jgi:hypothetical protein
MIVKLQIQIHWLQKIPSPLFSSLIDHVNAQIPVASQINVMPQSMASHFPLCSFQIQRTLNTVVHMARLVLPVSLDGDHESDNKISVG